MTYIDIRRTQQFDDGPQILAHMAGRSKTLLSISAIAFRDYVRGMKKQPLPAKNFRIAFLNERVFVDAFYPPPEGLDFLNKIKEVRPIIDALPQEPDDEAYCALFVHPSTDMWACVFHTVVPSPRFVFWDIGDEAAMRLRLDEVQGAANLAQFLAALRRV